MTRLAALALAFAATPASAATLTPWEPGASPCAGACSLEWAREQIGAPAGEMVPLTIPAGTPILWMSYARRGQPYGLDYHGRPTLRPLAAMGYPIGGGYWMVEIEECLNKAKVYLPGGAFTALLTEAGATEIAAPPPTSTPPGSTLPASPGRSVTVRWHEPIEVDIDPPEKPGPDSKPPAPAPVPLPAAGLLLLTGLGALRLLKRRRRG